MTAAVASNVLLLNSSYEPVSIISPQRAIRLLTLGKIHVVAESDISWRSVSIVIRVPTVVRLLEYVRGLGSKRSVVKLTRKNILLRDRYSCQYCGATHSTERLNIDHVIPKGQGGKSTWGNLVTSCIPCNNRKDCRTPKQAGMTLRCKPGKPSFFIFTLNVRYANGNYPKDWLDYLYWNVELKDD